MNTRAYAAYGARQDLKSYEFNRRDIGVHDVALEIKFAGICHSDIHTVRDEWGAAKCLEKLDSLYNNYHEDRYRASCLLRKYAVENKKFV